MTTPERLETGTLHRWRIVGHQPWGLDVERVLTPATQGVVDLLYIGIEGPVSGPDDYPPVGAEVSGIVQGYMPNGQLRVSLRQQDVESR